ncbi:MAG: DUF4395 domain-containing protein, partial [Chloroflexi bacterium]|nr:DUF4395 domain-containing protein [Chloroflexota bacterium]
MQQDLSQGGSSVCEDGVPLPIVTLNRSVLLGGVAIGLVAQQPLLTMLLFALLLPAV